MIIINLPQLKSYENFKKFLQRKLRGHKVFARKLIRQLCEDLIDPIFGPNQNLTTFITAKQYFGTEKGFVDWIQILFECRIIQRIRTKRCSEYRLSAKGHQYLTRIFDEHERGIKAPYQSLLANHSLNEAPSHINGRF